MFPSNRKKNGEQDGPSTRPGLDIVFSISF